MQFWVAMALIVGGSIAITFTIAAREYESPELQRRPSAAIQASEVLAQGGFGALRRVERVARDVAVFGQSGDGARHVLDEAGRDCRAFLRARV